MPPSGIVEQDLYVLHRGMLAQTAQSAARALSMPCGKLLNSFVFNEFRRFFHLYFARPSWFVHILRLIFLHALRPPFTYHRLGDVQYPGSDTDLPRVLQPA